MIKSLANNYSRILSNVVYGQGSMLFTRDGKKYIDAFSGYGATIFGHNYKPIVDTIIENSSKLFSCGGVISTEPLQTFADKITYMTHYDKVLPLNTGSEAFECAVMLSQKYGIEHLKIPHNHVKIVSFYGNFHGRTLGAISASTNVNHRFGRGALSDGFINAIPSIKGIKASMNPNVCAYIIEPIQGENGMIEHNPETLLFLRDFCKMNGILLIADEIQSGCGRTGSMYYLESLGIKPDILMLGKGLSGGAIPISVVLADNKIMKYTDVKSISTYGSTFGGNPLACAVASTVLDNLNKDIFNKVINDGLCFSDRFSDRLKNNHNNQSGIGLMRGIKVKNNKLFVEKLLSEYGIITTIANNNTVRYTPALNNGMEINDMIIDAYCELYSKMH